jgi:hypothetical protein
MKNHTIIHDGIPKVRYNYCNNFIARFINLFSVSIPYLNLQFMVPSFLSPNLFSEISRNFNTPETSC